MNKNFKIKLKNSIKKIQHLNNEDYCLNKKNKENLKNKDSQQEKNSLKSKKQQ